MIKLHLDLDKQFSDNPMIFIRVADGNADGIQAKITRDSAPVDLTGYSLAFEGITSAGKTVIDNTATGTADGLLSYTFSEQLAQSGGLFKSAYFSLTKGNTRTTTNNFELFVYTGADINGIDPADYINPYNDLIARLEKAYDAATKQVTDNVTSKIKVASDNADAQIKSVTDNATQHIKDLDAQVTALGKKIADYISGKEVEFKEFKTDFDALMTDSKTKVDELLKTAVKAGEQIGGRNLIVHTGEFVGQMVSPDGSIAVFDQSNAMKSTIPVTAGEWFTFHQETGVGNDQSFRWAWIDKDGKVISRQANGSNQIFNVQVPDNAVALRVSYPNVGRVKLERGRLASDWSDAPEDDAANYQTGQNLVYNSRYTNSAAGWDLNSGAGYLSSLAASSYDGCPGFGINSKGHGTTETYIFGTSKPRDLISTDLDITYNLYSMSAIVKVYQDSDASANIIISMSFLDASGIRVGYSERNVDMSNKEVWTPVRINGFSLPDGAVKIQIRYYAKGAHVHGMVVNPMIVQGPTAGEYIPDTVGAADVEAAMHNELDSSIFAGKILTADDDVLKLTVGGFYKFSGKPPVNSPGFVDKNGNNWGFYQLVDKGPTIRVLHYWDIFGHHRINIFSGTSGGWNGWAMPNSRNIVQDNGNGTIAVNGKIITPATMDDIQNAINTVKAYVDSKIPS